MYVSRSKSLLGVFFLLALGTVPIQAGLIPPVLLSKWSPEVPTPLQFAQTQPYEVETWTFRHPGAWGMKVRFDTLSFSCGGGYDDQLSRVEVLDSNGVVVQTLNAWTATPCTSVEVPGDMLQVRYVGNANGGTGVYGISCDYFRISGYQWRYSTLKVEGNGALLNYSVAAPLPFPANPIQIWKYSGYKFPVIVRKVWNPADDPKNVKVDFFMDSFFLGAAQGYRIPGDLANVYFRVDLDLAAFVRIKANHRMDTLVLRETRYIPNQATGWLTQYQYLNFPIALADSRCKRVNSFSTHFPSSNVETYIHITQAGMAEIVTHWTLGGNNPVDIDMELFSVDEATYTFNLIGESKHHGIQAAARSGTFVEGFSKWLTPGYYFVRVINPAGGCSGTSANFQVICEPQADYNYMPICQ